jgi:hypothetical protein
VECGFKGLDLNSIEIKEEKIVSCIYVYGNWEQGRDGLLQFSGSKYSGNLCIVFSVVVFKIGIF